MKALLIFVLLIFALFGFSEFLHIVKLRFIFPRRRLCAHIVINLQNETAEKQLLYAIEQLKWHGKDFADFIILFCDNLDYETYESCRKIALKYGINYPARI